MKDKKKSNYKNLNALIKKCDESVRIIKKKLNNKKCKTLNELYKKDQKGIVRREVDEFEALGYLPNVKNEIKGLYVFGEVDKTSGKVLPIYVGISRLMYKRLSNHGWGKTHNQATFAYLMASAKDKSKIKRDNFPLKRIQKAQNKIRKYKVAIIEEVDDYDLYFMEVFIAGKLSVKWNDFRTH